MLDKKLFVDLDRTLFNTDLLVAETWLYLRKKYGVNDEAEKARANQFYTYSGDLYNYDFFGHLDSLGIGSVDQLSFELTLYLQKQYLYYSDSIDGIEAIKQLGGATILTFGNDRYQNFKIACLPELASFPVAIVQEPKKHYFQEYCHEPSIMVDDKNLSRHLPDNVDFILIDRNQLHPVERHKGYTSIRKLQNIKEVLMV